MPRSANGVGSSPSFLRQRGLWVPSDLDSIHIWHRSDQLIALNGSDVSAWGDLTATGADTTQGTAIEQPAFLSSPAGFNGHPALDFDGIDDNLAYASGAVTSASTNYTFLVVCDSDIADTSVRWFWECRGTGANANRLGPVWTAGGGKHGATIEANSYPVAASSPATGAQFLTWVFDDTANTFSLYKNGVFVGTGSYPNPVFLSGTNAAIAAQFDGSSFNFDGRIAEIVIWDKKLITTELQSVHLYAARRYAK
jgi:hypothetical protein